MGAKKEKNKELSHIELQDLIIQKLKEVYDPEIPVNIYDLGLIYDIKVSLDKKAHILMTLTTPMCPVAQTLPDEVKAKLESIEELKEVKVELTWDPPWTMDRLSEEAKLALGLL